MSLTIKSLNSDTSFLLTFSPPVAPLSSPGLFPGSFTILLDPWIVGPSIILNSIFSHSEQKNEPCITSLKELEREPDLILISQHKPDHCHEETLRQLPRDCESTILATPAAVKKIQSWNHFRPERIHALTKYVEGDDRSIYRVVLPPPTPRGSCGEVTISWLPAKRDVTAVHHAIGITYRPPCTVLSMRNPGYYLDLPMSPPASPRSPLSPMAVASSPRTIVPSPNNDREKTLSVIYSPHGVSFDTIRPYATSHLVSESALPLTALLHSFDCVDNPWWLGGNICAGSPGGLEIARSLYARAWISAHDADKDNRGWAVKQTRIGQFAVDEVMRMLESGHHSKRPSATRTEAVSLAAGEEHRIEVG
ncbi:hypothetical protein IQ06DRAFT_152297 [Phaeosphaeriaceae sp. SRC1lsM3a]|nr:hypothetical protein IQ06DRAFT_152297 [Stagonospora sp. SRC1lsM3a]